MFRTDLLSIISSLVLFHPDLDAFQSNSHTAHKYWPYRGSNVNSDRRTP